MWLKLYLKRRLEISYLYTHLKELERKQKKNEPFIYPSQEIRTTEK